MTSLLHLHHHSDSGISVIGKNASPIIISQIILFIPHSSLTFSSLDSMCLSMKACSVLYKIGVRARAELRVRYHRLPPLFALCLCTNRLQQNILNLHPTKCGYQPYIHLGGEGIRSSEQDSGSG